MIARTALMAAALLVALLGPSPASAELKKWVAQGGAPVPYIAFVPIYVAQQAGFFKDEGLDVEMRYSSGAPQATQIAAAGQADSANVTVEPTISGYDKGIRGKIVMRTNKRLIYYLAVPADSPIKTVADMQGKKVGVANFGSAAVPVVRSILRSAGIQPAADTLLPVGVMDQALAALQSGNVQVLGLYDGIYYALERSGREFRYFYHPTLAGFGNGGLFIPDAVIASRPKDVCGYARSYAKGVLFAIENPEAALRMYWAVATSARRQGSEADALAYGRKELDPMLDGYDIGFPPQGRYGVIDRAAFQQYMDLNKQEGVVTAVPPIDAIVTDQFIDCINQFDGDAVRKLAREWKK